MNSGSWIAGRCRAAAVGFAFAAVAAGCATTQQVAVSEKSSTYCPFLGAALCAKLTPTDVPGRLSGSAMGGGGTPLAGLRYINPNAQWTQYNKIMIEPVTFWGGDNTSVSPTDQHALTNYFFASLNTALAKKFQIVDHPGPGVMEIQVALDDAESATPVLRSVSMIVPQARALATLKYLATSTYPFVGGAQAEVKITDSVTGQVLLAGVDKRVGGGSLKTAAQWQWGDAENAIDAWSQQGADRLSLWTSGTPPT
jgi:hypothetical protein